MAEDIEWFIPDIVYKERLYQVMSNIKRDYFKPYTKLKDVLNLGDDLLPNLEYLNKMFTKRFENELSTNSITIIKTDFTKINLENLSEKALQRTPPFTDHKDLKEKGFRDSLIVENFFQNVFIYDLSDKIMLTSDDGLSKAINLRKKETADIQIIDSLSNLETFLNAKKQNIEQTIIDIIVPEASKSFFTKGDKNSFWHLKVKEEVLDTCQYSIYEPYFKGGENEVTKFEIGSTVFMNKETANTINLCTTIRVNITSYNTQMESIKNIKMLNSKNLLLGQRKKGELLVQVNWIYKPINKKVKWGNILSIDCPSRIKWLSNAYAERLKDLMIQDKLSS